MIKLAFFLAIVFLVGALTAHSQTCTIGSSMSWNNASPPPCQEGGNAGSASLLVIPSGVIVNFDNNGDTWTGSRIDVFGTLRISAPGQVTINANMNVKSGGLLDVLSKINIGTGSGCGYTLMLDAGATANVGSGASDRLNICSNEIARGAGGGCNLFPNGPLPYCEPPGGFVGPLIFDENGANTVLPIRLLYFRGKNYGSSVMLDWATSTEEEFDYFIVQHLLPDHSFVDIGRIPGAIKNTVTIQKYSHEHTSPLIGTNYYRLKAFDLDGSFRVFNAVSVKVSGDKKIWVSPNPTFDDRIVFNANFSPPENSKIEISDERGSVVIRRSLIRVPDTISFSLKPGVYILRYADEDLVQTVRFIVLARP